MAEGSQGWRPNWADLPVAAKSRPIRGSKAGFMMNSCWRSHEFELVKNHAIASTNPMSPTRLYRMA